jgi:hypothetical protein
MMMTMIIKRAPSTHPGYASLADPLFAFGRKRVEEIIQRKKTTLFPACGREGGRAKQGPGELSRFGKRAPSTHPGYASLADPLFAFGGQRVVEIIQRRKITLFPACGREGGQAERGPGESLPLNPSLA